MKREILCIKCTEKVKELLLGSKPIFEDGHLVIVDRYPGEHSKFVYGKVNSGSNIQCDHCNITLKDDACAISIWADYGGIPYYKWEDAYLNIEKEV